MEGPDGENSVCALSAEGSDSSMSDSEVGKLAESLAEAASTGAPAPDGLSTDNTNSRTEHRMYMQFYRKFNTKRIGALHPSLVEKFKDPSQKSTLFLDYFRVKGNLAQLDLLMTKRVEFIQLGKTKFKMFTREDLMDKFHNNSSYVDLIIQDA
eukprot:2078705-Alexandrium_andersonii.AAC.1